MVDRGVRFRGRAREWRFMVWFVVIFTICGVLYPSLLPATEFHYAHPKSVRYRIYQILGWLPLYCLPRGLPDIAEMSLSILSVLLLGIALGFPLNILWKRIVHPVKKGEDKEQRAS